MIRGKQLVVFEKIHFAFEWPFGPNLHSGKPTHRCRPVMIIEAAQVLRKKWNLDQASLLWNAKNKAIPKRPFARGFCFLNFGSRGNLRINFLRDPRQFTSGLR